LVIEGAGGVLVPLNDTDTVLDIIKPEYNVIVVSRHYLGSINHTLLSIEALQNKGIKNIFLIFSGDEHKTTEEIISKKTGISVIGRISEENGFSKIIIKKYANMFKDKLDVL